MNRKERLDLANWAMEYALKKGADQSAISLSNSREIEIEFREKKLDKVKESTQNSLNLNIYAKQRYSGHSTNDLRKNSLKKFIEEAVASTKYLTKDEYRSLPDPKYYPKKTDIDLKLCDKGYSKLESTDRVKMAKEIEAAAMAQSDKIITATSSYSDGHYESIKVQSNGFMGETESTSFWAGAEVTVKDGEEGRPEDWYYAGVRFHDDLPEPKIIGEKAAQRALRKIGQKKLQSGKYDMLVENRSAGRLIGLLQNPMTARAIQQKSSFLDGMLGKKIASEKLTLIDDPFVEKAFGSRLYDNEGIATKKKIIIDKGILKQYYIDNYYGKKLGWEPNSGSTTNLMPEYGAQNLDEMVKHIKKGILVNGFIGGNSNATSGDFSFGIVGLLIEDGKIIHPVNEMNITGNSKDFFNQLVAVGNDPYPYSSWKMPSFLFEGIQFSGI